MILDVVSLMCMLRLAVNFFGWWMMGSSLQL